MPRHLVERRFPYRRAANAERAWAAPGAAGRNAGAVPLVGWSFRRFASLVSRWLKQGAERRCLQNLGDHMLEDMGILRQQVERDVRPGWSSE